MAGALFGATPTAWILLLLASVFIKGPRPTPGPATLTPGHEAPAIVDLLVHGWKPARAAPVPKLQAARDHLDLLAHGRKPTRAAPVATLLDLAARGHLQLVAEPASRLICVLPTSAQSEPLALFEHQVLQQVARRLSGDSAPAAALLPDPEDEDGKRWYATFESAVIDEARHLGLVRDRFSTPVRWGLRTAGALPAAALGWWLFSLANGGQLLALLSSLGGWGAPLGLPLVCLMALGLVVLAGRATGGIRGTAIGCAAASRWLGVRSALLTAARPPQLPEAETSLSDRLLAWAVALDAAPSVLTALTPAHDGRVWSSVAGRWRQVGLSERATVDPWVRFWWGLYTPPGRRSARRTPLAVSERRTFTGRVLRRWTRAEDVLVDGNVMVRAFHYHLAVDDGRSDQALAWEVRKSQYKRFTRDTEVQVTIDDQGRLINIAKAARPGATD